MAELFNVAKGKKVNALGSNTAAITDGITEAGCIGTEVRHRLRQSWI